MDRPTDSAQPGLKAINRLDEIVHEMGSPLLAITLAVQMTLRTLPPDATAAREALERADGQAARLSKLLRELAEISRSG